MPSFEISSKESGQACDSLLMPGRRHRRPRQCHPRRPWGQHAHQDGCKQAQHRSPAALQRHHRLPGSPLAASLHPSIQSGTITRPSRASCFTISRWQLRLPPILITLHCTPRLSARRLPSTVLTHCLLANRAHATRPRPARLASAKPGSSLLKPSAPTPKIACATMTTSLR
jgi:hypothetical protein